MATYKITEVETSRTRKVEATGWNDNKLKKFEDQLDNEGYPKYEVELECDHYDNRICDALGHAGGN